MTSVALITAVTLSPFLRPISSALREISSDLRRDAEEILRVERVGAAEEAVGRGLFVAREEAAQGRRPERRLRGGGGSAGGGEREGRHDKQNARHDSAAESENVVPREQTS